MDKWFSAIVAFAVSLAFAAGAMADEPKAGGEPSPAARQLMDKVKAAYAQLQSMQLTGRVAADLDVAGQTRNRSGEITAVYRAPLYFRHEVKGEVTAGSTGKKLYVLEAGRNVYATADLPDKKVPYRQLPSPFGELLEVQDPALILALSAGSIDDMVEGGKRVKVVADTNLGKEALPTLSFVAADGRVVSLAFDPGTYLLRQAQYDVSDLMRNRGAEKVNKALVTISYDQVKPGVALDEAQFAWTPPANAQEVGQGDEDEAVLALQGKPAPDFTLPTVDGKQVTLSSLKGSIVLLDFWATWCGPCVMSLPEINDIYHSRRVSGLQVFAVNAGEEKEQVAGFLEDKRLDLPVLLDSDQSVIEKLGVRAFPTTMIIGPDGVVRKVFIGVPPGGKADIEQAIEQVAKK